MSHDGIRILRGAPPPEPEAALSFDARTPAKVCVKKTEGTGVEIDWNDGHHSHWTFAWLRNACPCATCHEEREHTGRPPGEAKPRPVAVFAMYEPPVRPVEVTPVGKYALRFKWNDGHDSGIYSWEYLRRACQCNACAGAAAKGDQARVSPK